MPNLLTRIVTPTFIAFNAHCWFAYAITYTFPNTYVIHGTILAAGVKEFYIDKHFEASQSFADNAVDFLGYLSGIVLAVVAHSVFT